MRWIPGAVLATLVCSTLAAVPHANAAPYLTVDGEVATPLALSDADFSALPHTSVKVKDAGGVEVTYGGVQLGDILRKAGVPLQKDLKGKDVAKYLHAQGADGFVAVFALPEFDSGAFLVADSVNGAPLPADAGPLQIVSPAETRHSRWIKQLTNLRIKISQM